MLAALVTVLFPVYSGNVVKAEETAEATEASGQLGSIVYDGKTVKGIQFSDNLFDMEKEKQIIEK